MTIKATNINDVDNVTQPPLSNKSKYDGGQAPLPGAFKGRKKLSNQFGSVDAKGEQDLDFEGGRDNRRSPSPQPPSPDAPGKKKKTIV